LFCNHRKKVRFKNEKLFICFVEMRKGAVKKKQGRSQVLVVGVVFVILLIVLAAFLWPAKKKVFATSAPKVPEGSVDDGSTLGNFDKWESEFDSVLWSSEVGPTLKDPPFLFESPGAIIKELDDPKNKSRSFRVLMFDQSGEVQGANVFDKVFVF
jgi:hypothetical protein